MSEFKAWDKKKKKWLYDFLIDQNGYTIHDFSKDYSLNFNVNDDAILIV